MKMYRLFLGINTIIEYEIVGITPQTVSFKYPNGDIKTEKKLSNFISWHESREKAISYFKGSIENEIESMKQMINAKEEILERFLKENKVFNK